MLAMTFNFTGKNVLVTGAGRGIGRGIAVTLVNAGCKVYALDKYQQGLSSLAAENDNIVTIHQDLTDWEGTRAALEKLEALDGLVNNAGVILGVVKALDQTKEELETYMTVNLLAGINCIQVIGKKLVDSGRKGSIVNISSHVSMRAFPGALGYNMAKAGVDMVTKQFALELGPHNIRVNSVNSTLTATNLKEKLDELADVEQHHVERTPMGRINTIDDVVGPVLYLLSDASAMVTGTNNLVDGGISCNITIKQYSTGFK